MKARTPLLRTSVSIFLAAGILAAAQDSGEAQEFGKAGPSLESVKAFGDDFRPVGIGVSAKGDVQLSARPIAVKRRWLTMSVAPRETGGVSSALGTR